MGKNVFAELENKFPAVKYTLDTILYNSSSSAYRALAKDIMKKGRPLVVKLIPQELLLFMRDIMNATTLTPPNMLLVLSTPIDKLPAELDKSSIGRKGRKVVYALELDKLRTMQDVFSTVRENVISTAYSYQKEVSKKDTVSSDTSLFDDMVASGFALSKSIKEELDNGANSYIREYGVDAPTPESYMVGMKSRVEKYVEHTYFGIAGGAGTFGAGVFSGCCMRYGSAGQNCVTSVVYHMTPKSNKNLKVVTGKRDWHDVPVMLMHKQWRLAAYTFIQRIGVNSFTLLLDNIEVNENVDKGLITAESLKNWLDAVASAVKFSLERYMDSSIKLKVVIGARNTEEWLSDLYVEMGMYKTDQTVSVESLYIHTNGYVHDIEPYLDSADKIWLFGNTPKKGKK